MQPPPEGATFCEDYNAYTSNTTCNQIAGDPWYMPCKLDTSTERCVFRGQAKFGNETRDLKKITNKKDCEFAGGEWKTEFYCEGDKAVPSGWCEMKTGAEKKSCDAACWACEFQPNGTRWNSSAAATTGCQASKLCYCSFRNDSSAPNGFGYCEEPEEIRLKGDCSSNCKACELMNATGTCNPRRVCEASSAKCKWVNDTSNGTKTTIGGWCYPQTEKSCGEDCFKCYNDQDCVNYGKGTKGSCTWDSDTKICMPVNFDKEICFDGMDNDGDNKVDCEDSDCSSDSFCGAGMISNCWKYSTQQKCVGNGTAEGCVWIIDPLTSKSWCGKKGENCFLWDGDPSGCGNQTGVCQWFNDTSSKGGFCEINSTKVQACFKLTTEGACKANSDCKWSMNPVTKTGTCEFKLTKCEGLSNSTCNTTCSWEVDPVDKTKGKCVGKCLGGDYQNQGKCSADSNCKWMSGFCDPASSLGMNMGDCWKFTNQSNCTAAAGCEWFIGKTGTAKNCDFNLTLERDVCAQKFNQQNCTAVSLNGVSVCKWNPTPDGKGFCDLKVHGCGWYNTQETCGNDTDGCNGGSCGGCVWKTVTFSSGSGGVGYMQTQPEGRCEPKCFNETLPQNQCTGQCAPTGSGGGRCESKMAKMMFAGMDTPPVPLGSDACNETGMGAEQDICNFGVKDSPDNYGFGMEVKSIENAAVCKGQQVIVNKQTRDTVTGSGTNTTKFYWYLDTDGSETGGCWLHNNESAVGYEFFFKYVAEWKDGALKETKTAYRCDDGEWVITDIKFSGWQNFMCGEIGGGMISIDKSDLNKFPDLYKSENKMRIYMATGNKTTSETNPTTSKRFVDTAGPVYYSPGTMDFKFEDCMTSGVDMDGDGLKSENDPDCKMFQQFGYVKYESCFETGVDEDGDGLIDCNDPDCKFASSCVSKGVNAANYTDTIAPKLNWKDVDVFPDGAFIKYDTDEPANGSVTLYFNS
ncbi:MAG: hypothetical protein HZC29_02905, partial [Thaumarchaeota archaeon]|nr:hypothetical protein [Nitrososphaerota archaeon]